MDERVPLPLSGVIIARNEADRIGRCVRSLRGVCSEIVVLDSGSTDDTVRVARDAGARVEHQDWLGFGPQKNAAIARATRPWLLLMDADEWLEPGADAELHDMFATGRIDAADVWLVLRHNRFLGGRLHRPERMPRLMRSDVRFLPMRVHEKPDVTGRRVAPSRVAIGHDTARGWEDHVRKQDLYARLWAEQRHSEGKRCGPLSPWTHVVAYWLKSYLLRFGLRDGRTGWLFHKAHARGVIRKYRALRALGRGGPSRD